MIHCPTDIVTGRTVSLFARDMATRDDNLSDALSSSRCLVIGGAGSIGGETVRLLSRYSLKSLTIIDQDENGLTRLMRRLRSDPDHVRVATIDPIPVDYGSAYFLGHLETDRPYDFVFNFAAVKHVRSEKDVVSILHMMDTNILKQARLIKALSKSSPDCRYFSVSTDKAANPVSFMGATKRLMEHVIFQLCTHYGLRGGCTSARFANVAYSQGSLLESFADRMEQRVPLAAPRHIQRFFVSLEEAGQLCILAGLLAPDNTIVIPDLDPARNLISMEDVAKRFLKANGYDAEVFPLRHESDARKSFNALNALKRWPLVLTPADTPGEKPYEEFVGENEVSSNLSFSDLKGIAYQSSQNNPDQILELVSRLSDLMTDIDAIRNLSTEDLKDLIAEIEPDFAAHHKVGAQQLDSRV